MKEPAIPALFLQLPLYLWFPMVFLIGAVVGSFLNVCIYRLPLEKSPLWPLSSRCGHCLQPLRAVDNLPLLSYWLLRGRCRTCKSPFSIRYFLIELGTAIGFVGLFYLEVVENVHNFDEKILFPHAAQLGALAAFIFHAILFSFLLVATFCDVDHRAIPLSLTITGAIVGLIGSVLLPWPWPYTPAQASPTGMPLDSWVLSLRGRPLHGVYSWPVLGPLPAWLAPGGNWQTGLATGVAGFLAGTVTLRLVRFAFGIGVGPEYSDDPDPESVHWGLPRRLWDWFGRVGGKTLGLGDADLMMMAGAFLGWQLTITAFFLAVVPGLFFGMVQIFQRGENALPFGPSLAIGAMFAALFWHDVADPLNLQSFFFNLPFVGGVLVMVVVLLMICGYVLRIARFSRPDEKS